MELIYYDFFINAVIACVLASITCGIVGTYIVMRRLVFLAGGVTHSSFGGIGAAYYFGFDPVKGAVLFSMASSVAIDFMSRKAAVRNDSVIAILWSAGMALGLVLVYLTPGYAPNLMNYLFGNILTVSAADLWVMGVVAVVVVVVFSVFYRTILFVSFDGEFARTRRVPVGLINMFMMLLIAVVIVINIKVAGIILILSLFTIPQNIANELTCNFRNIMIVSFIINLFGSIGGMIASYYLNIPSGPAIILVLVFFFIIMKLFVFFRDNSRRFF